MEEHTSKTDWHFRHIVMGPEKDPVYPVYTVGFSEPEMIVVEGLRQWLRGDVLKDIAFGENRIYAQRLWYGLPAEESLMHRESSLNTLQKLIELNEYFICQAPPIAGDEIVAEELRLAVLANDLLKEGFPEALQHTTRLQRFTNLAEVAHRGQQDKSGKPYINHPREVMYLVEPFGEEYQIVGVLHDVIEHTHLAYDDLHLRGLEEHLVEAVNAMTKRLKDQDYAAANYRATGNPISHIVKLADNTHNSSEKRLSRMDPKVAERLRIKYKGGLNYLLGDGEPHIQEALRTIRKRMNELEDK